MTHKCTIENGSYYLRDDKSPQQIIARCDKVSIMFDRDEGVILKHGSMETVQTAFDRHRERLMSADYKTEKEKVLEQEMLEATIVIEGEIPLEDLNKMITHSGYVKI